jgi:hypothetical protein
MAILLVKEGMDFSDPTDEDFYIPATIIVVGLCQFIYWVHSRRYLGLREWHRWNDTLDNFLVNQEDLKQTPLRIPWWYKIPGIIGSLGLAGFMIIWLIVLVDEGENIIEELFKFRSSRLPLTIALWFLFLSFFTSVPALIYNVRTLFTKWAPESQP